MSAPPSFTPANHGTGGEGPTGGAWRSAPRPRAGKRRTGLAAVVAAAVAVFAVSLAGLVVQLLPRTFTPRQRQQIATWEMSARWRLWTAGRIFPAQVSYRLPASLFGGGEPVSLMARRVGIRQASCRAAVDAAAARALDREGCLAALRATYDDATQTLAVTVGVVVLPDPGAARASLGAFPASGPPRPGLRTVAFPRTPVAWFDSAPRQVSWHALAGPYLILAVAGYADGRSRAGESAGPYARGEMSSLASGVGRAVAGALGAQPPPPRCPGGPAC